MINKKISYFILNKNFQFFNASFRNFSASRLFFDTDKVNFDQGIVKLNLSLSSKVEITKMANLFAKKYSRVDLEQEHLFLSKEIAQMFSFFYKIEEFKNILDRPIILIENVPIDPKLPNSPISHDSPKEKSSYSESTMLGIIHSLQYNPYICFGEKNDSLFHNVVPLPGDEYIKSGTGSKIKFDWHTENIHEDYPPDAIALFCLRGDKNAHTSLLPLEDILSIMTDEDVRKLKEPKYIMKTGPSFKKPMEHMGPILEEDLRGNMSIRYNSDHNRLFSENNHSQISLDKCKKIVEEITPKKSKKVTLKSGDLLFFNNNNILHKRDPFQVSTLFEERRWLQRVYSHKKSKTNNQEGIQLTTI